MKIYYYIDDEVDIRQSIADGINEYQIVQVNVLPLANSKEFGELTDKLKNDWDHIDGLILDLKLDGGGVESTKFTATSLAQWIASYVVSEDKAAKPIILISNNLNSAKFKADVTSHDLFDMVLDREQVDWKEFAKILGVLAEDYYKLNHDKEKKLSDLFQNKSLDSSSTCFAPFINAASFNVSQFARFVLNDLFIHPGLLVSEELLAARYGVDIDKSGDAWKIFKTNCLNEALYKGVFCQIKERYWSKKAQDLYVQFTKGKSAASMTTIQRITALKHNYEEAKDLVAYEPIDKDKSTYCWSIDEVTKKPLDSANGYMIQEEGGLKSWQEPRFLSFDTIESGIKGDFRLVPSEQERYNEDLAALDD